MGAFKDSQDGVQIYSTYRHKSRTGQTRQSIQILNSLQRRKGKPATAKCLSISTRCSKRTALRSLAELCAAGLVERHNGSPGSPDTFAFLRRPK